VTVGLDLDAYTPPRVGLSWAKQSYGKKSR
jgi:hypothetical protein